jgi:hypothetical protein
MLAWTREPSRFHVLPSRSELLVWRFTGNEYIVEREGVRQHRSYPPAYFPDFSVPVSRNGDITAPSPRRCGSWRAVSVYLALAAALSRRQDTSGKCHTVVRLLSL